MKLGTIVFVVLAILTGVEYTIATQLHQNLIPLILMAQVKAVLILWYFMHIARAWFGQREGH